MEDIVEPEIASNLAGIGMATAETPAEREAWEFVHQVIDAYASQVRALRRVLRDAQCAVPGPHPVIDSAETVLAETSAWGETEVRP